MTLVSVELCAGAGGQALGLEQAGYEHEALVEIDAHACQTLRTNRPQWTVFEEDLNSPVNFIPSRYKGIDLLAGGLPCPPFSIAGKQLGEKDERNLFNRGIEIINEMQPRAVMFENVRGMLGKSFEEYRELLGRKLRAMGYSHSWKLLNASDFGVPQLRPRVVLVALKNEYQDFFEWPKVPLQKSLSVGETLLDLMAGNGWKGAADWSRTADRIAPTIVGGSKKHGGPDLGPTRAKQAWLELGVNGMGIANEAPDPGFDGNPKLTVKMVARLQGFPDDWHITGNKTNAYRQVGNAFPPPVARAVAKEITSALSKKQVFLFQAAE